MRFSQLAYCLLRITLNLGVLIAGLVVSATSLRADSLFRGNLERTGVYSEATTLPAGKISWKHRVGDPKINSVFGDLILCSPAASDGKVFFGNQRGVFYALDAKTGDEAWSFKAGAAIRGTAAVVNGTVYFGCHDKNIYALDAWTGEKKWVCPTGGLVRSSPAVWRKEEYHEVFSNWLLVGSQDGFLYALDAENGKLKWRFQTGGPVFSSPAVVGNLVFFGSNDGNVYAVDLGTGKEKWRFNTGYWVTAAPAIMQDSVYIPSWDGNLYALRAATGEKLWSYAMPEVCGRSISASPTVTEDLVYIGYRGSDKTSGTRVYAIRRQNGELAWEFTMPKAMMEASPTVVGDLLIVADAGELRALDKQTGTPKWKVSVGPRKEIFSSPVYSEGILYFGDCNANMNAVQ